MFLPAGVTLRDRAVAAVLTGRQLTFRLNVVLCTQFAHGASVRLAERVGFTEVEGSSIATLNNGSACFD
jgi:hypothetical protein